MKRGFQNLVVGLLMAGICNSAPVSAQPVGAEALLQPFYDFENDMTPWIGIGDEAKLSLAHGADDFKVGQGALRFDYGVRAGKINALVLPTALHGLDSTRAVTFWIKTDYPTLLSVLLQEREGGRYATMFSVRGNQWQRVELAFSDFYLLQGADDPKDANGTLDVSQIEGISLADMGQIYAGAADPKLVDMLGLKPGPHALLLDDFALSRVALAPPTDAGAAPEIEKPATDETESLEPLWHPQIAWLPLGGAQLSIETAAGMPGKSLQMQAMQKPGSITGAVRRLPAGMLRAARQIGFEATSDQATLVLVQLEESSGGKYRAMARLSGGKIVNAISLDIANFRAADDSKDDDGRLDLEQVTQIALLDISGLLDGTGAKNGLNINNLRVVR